MIFFMMGNTPVVGVGFPPAHDSVSDNGDVCTNCAAQPQVPAICPQSGRQLRNLAGHGLVSAAPEPVQFPALFSQRLYLHFKGLREHGEFRVCVNAVFVEKLELPGVPLKLNHFRFGHRRFGAVGRCASCVSQQI